MNGKARHALVQTIETSQSGDGIAMFEIVKSERT